MKKKHFLFTLKVILLTFYSVAGHNPIRCFLPKNCLHTIAMIAVTFKIDVREYSAFESSNAASEN